MAALVDQAADTGADLVAFAEMDNTDWAANPWQFEALNGPTLTAMRAKARQRGLYIVCPLLTLEDGQRYNSSVLLDRQGNVAGHYHKYFPTHLELNQGILPGTETPVFETDLGRIGLSICFDLNYWEVGAGLCANRAELVIWSSMWEGRPHAHPLGDRVWLRHGRGVHPPRHVRGPGRARDGKPQAPE